MKIEEFKKFLEDFQVPDSEEMRIELCLVGQEFYQNQHMVPDPHFTAELRIGDRLVAPVDIRIDIDLLRKEIDEDWRENH